MKKWLVKKSFCNWLVVLMISMIVSALVSSILLGRYLVNDIKQLEGAVTEYEHTVATYQNAINSALDTIHKLQNK